MKKIGLLFAVMAVVLLTACMSNSVGRDIVNEGKRYSDKEKISADLDTLDEIIMSIQTAYSDVSVDEDAIMQKDGFYVVVTRKGTAIVGLDVKGELYKELVDIYHILDESLKSRQWGDATIKVSEKCSIMVESDGDENIADFIDKRYGGTAELYEDELVQQEGTEHRINVTPDNVDDILVSVQEETKTPSTYTVTMKSTRWEFADGESESDNAYVENSTDNMNAVYFDITLNQTGETIYQSPVIPVGSHLEHIRLDKELSKGTYDCTMVYYLIDDSQNVLSTVNVALAIMVND